MECTRQKTQRICQSFAQARRDTESREGRPRLPSDHSTIMAPWDQWRHDVNNKLDKWGEEKLHMPAHSEKTFGKSFGKKRNMSYEERLASLRSGGGAMGAMETQPRPRAVPPPPPGHEPDFSSTYTSSPTASQAPPPPQSTRSLSSETASTPTTASTHASFSTGAGSGGTTHIEFSRFSESDKQAFFALLDEYFVKRSSGGGDMWYVSIMTY